MSVAVPQAGVRRRRFAAVLGGLTAANLVINLLALVTGPLQARLLGPQGRGELALVMVVTTFAPWILGLGLGSYLAREIARSERRGVLLGTVVVLSLVLGLVGTLLAYPLASLFGRGQPDEVRNLIFVGLLLLPFGLVAINLHGAYWGLEDWRRFSAMRILPPLFVVVAYLALAAFGAFTVTTAALATFAGGLLALVPLAPLLRGTRGWGFDRETARRALGFGSKASVAAVANQGNVRIDQLFIAAVVSTRELGFYVVAVTLAAASSIVSQALNYMVVPMVATGDRHAVRRILRATLAAMTLAAVVLALVAAPVVRLLFGPEFGESADLVRILCFGAVFVAGKGIVSAALVGHGRPGEPALVEVASFALLAVALALVVPAAGATGAAVAVVLAGAASFLVLVLRTRTALGGRLASYLLLTPGDAGWVADAVRRALRRRAAANS